MNMVVDVREELNAYLEEELDGAVVLPDIKEIERQRRNFLARFGPDRLKEMDDQELLREIPHNVSNSQSMDYWLEFKNDQEFDKDLFGSISGGSAAKFLTWQQKDTENWLVLTPRQRVISEDEAIDIIETRRAEILKSVRALQRFENIPVEDIDSSEFQSAVEEAAPTMHHYGWMHKYLHILFPDLVSSATARSWKESQLYSVGIVPPDTGTYSCGIEIIRFWNSLPALNHLPTQIRYQVAKNLYPRDHWCLNVGDPDTYRSIMNGYLSFGPSDIGSLEDAVTLSRKGAVAQIVETAFDDAKLDPKSSDAKLLINLIYRLREGSIIALMDDSSSVIGLFEVIGGYHYERSSQLPHQIPVEHLEINALEKVNAIEIDVSVESGAAPKKLKPTNHAVSAIESLLLLDRLGGKRGGSRSTKDSGWQAFFDNAPSEISSESTPMVWHVPSEGIERRVAEMLDRKGQVILYGPPGTGKTYYAERTALELVARRNFNCLPTQLTSTQKRDIHGESASTPTPYLATCTFHPMYSYEDFIEGYRPDEGDFKLEAGIFKQMADAASKQWNRNKCFVLIIDEINRGNIPKIFGELITLIEKSKRGTTSSLLPLSKEPFTVPDNLLIIGTMNTADRSAQQLDFALRRRFAFIELPPEPNLLRTEAINDVPLSIWLRALNRRLVENLERDGRNLQIGHAYLMPEGKPAATLRRIGEIFHEDIWPLLQEYCYENPRKLASILGHLYNESETDLRHELFKPGRQDELAKALNSIVAPEDTMREAEEVPPSTDDDEDDDEADSSDTDV